MLDQNTDRMWFVIGAVIVGAAIIFIANGTLPDVFASVTDSFRQVSSSAEQGIYEDVMGYKLVMKEMLEPTTGASVDFIEDGSFLLTVDDALYSGVQVRPGRVSEYGFEPNSKYRMEYTLEPYDGPLSMLQHEVGNVNYEVHKSLTYVDDVKYSLQEPIELDNHKNRYDIGIVLETSDVAIPLNALVIRPNGWIHSPTTVKITNLRIIKE